MVAMITPPQGILCYVMDVPVTTPLLNRVDLCARQYLLVLTMGRPHGTMCPALQCSLCRFTYACRSQS